MKIFELATNEPLFPLMSFGLTREQIDEEHYTLINKVIDDDPANNRCFTAYLKEKLPHCREEDVMSLVSFLGSMLQRDLHSRKSTTALLCHPFLEQHF